MKIFFVLAILCVVPAISSGQMFNISLLNYNEGGFFCGITNGLLPEEVSFASDGKYSSWFDLVQGEIGQVDFLISTSDENSEDGQLVPPFTPEGERYSLFVKSDLNIIGSSNMRVFLVRNDFIEGSGWVKDESENVFDLLVSGDVDLVFFPTLLGRMYMNHSSGKYKSIKEAGTVLSSNAFLKMDK